MRGFPFSYPASLINFVNSVCCSWICTLNDVVDKLSKQHVHCSRKWCWASNCGTFYKLPLGLVFGMVQIIFSEGENLWAPCKLHTSRSHSQGRLCHLLRLSSVKYYIILQSCSCNMSQICVIPGHGVLMDTAEIARRVNEEAGLRAQARGLPLGCFLCKISNLCLAW